MGSGRGGAGFRRRVRSAAWAVGCLALVAGCSSAGGGEPGSLPANVPVRAVTSSAISLPLDSYELNFQQQVLVDKAFTWLANNCMKSYGLSSSSGLLGRLSIPGQFDLALVSPLSLQSAQKYGYNPPLTAVQKEVQKLESGQVAPGAGGVLVGQVTTYAGKPVPAGGCMGKAGAELVGKLGRAFPLVRASLPPGVPKQVRERLRLGQLPAGAIAYRNLTGMGGLVRQLAMTSDFRMQTDPKLAAARARWHECMLKAGFNYNAPEAASGDSRWSSGSAPSAANRALEIRVATADARCEAEVNYAGVEVALLTGYQNRLINQNVTALAAFKQEEQRLVANANAVLAGRRTA